MDTLTQNNVPEEVLMNFTELTKPILSLIKKHWDFKVSPKGYKEFIENYEEGNGMGEDQYDLHDDFKALGGVFNTSASTPALPGWIDMPTVAYNHKEQGRPPMQTLIGALINYGITMGQAQEKRFSGGQSKEELLNKLLELYDDKSKLRNEIKELKEQLAAKSSS